MIIRIIYFLMIVSLLACNTSKLKETSMDKFIGEWKIEGRSMFEGMTISINKNKEGKLKGVISKLNDNKYINMFAEINDTWVSSINRNSNYSFSITEKKIGAQLFSLYGQSTSTKFNTQFIDDNTFAIAKGNANPTKSSILYKRIK